MTSLAAVAAYQTATDADIPALGRLISLAFGGSLEAAAEWVAKQGVDDMRVIRDGSGPPPACYRRIPMGQFFGGHSVKMLGIAGVATAPEARGRGHARTIMQHAMREASADGFAISCLYASTQSLYRQIGYEQAGHRWIARVPLVHLDVKEGSRDVIALAPGEFESVKPCYASFSPRFDGMLERGQYVWKRVAEFRDKPFDGWAVRENGRIVAYMFMRQERKENGRQSLELNDLAFDHELGLRALLGFLADFGSMADEVTFPAGPCHPALLLPSQQRYDIRFKESWMLRIIRVGDALTSRGYAPGLDAEVRLEITDDLLPENAGTWTMCVRDGRATVERDKRGGVGTVKCGPRGLAAMYSGFMHPRALAMAGLVEGDSGALATAGAIFAAGTPPWMTDFF